MTAPAVVAATAQSILDLFLRNVAACPEQAAVMVKRKGAYQEIPWRDVAAMVNGVGAGLIALGVEAGDRVGILGNTRLEWLCADLGILAAGGVTVPVYPSNLPDECQYIAEDAGTVVFFCENAMQSEKLLAERRRLPGVRAVVQIEGDVPAGAGNFVVPWTEFLKRGEAAEHVATLAARRNSLTPDSILTIIYTSGTTGRPKGVITTHGSMLYEAKVIADIDVVREDDVQLLFLPLAHSFAKVLMISWLATRHILAFAENIESIRQNLVEARPTIMCGVPRVFEKVHGRVVQTAHGEGGVKAALFRRAEAVSERVGRAELEGRKLSWLEQAEYDLVRKVVFSKVADRLQAGLGGRMRLMVSGGAPLSPRINWFFRDAGLTILEGYGLTETSAGTIVNRPGQNRIGTVGTAIPGTEVRIAPDGEILVRGPGVMPGYWKKPEATAEVLEADGWFHTGDIGELDARGYLRITDRKKDIIVTAGGKNIAPQNIENMLKTHPLVSQVVVHGDRRKFLSALITLDVDALRSFAKEHRLGEGSYAELTQRPEVSAEVQRVVDSLNAKLASYETIKKFKILPQDLSQETGEMTPTMKVKRKVMNERYRQVFDSFYDESY